MNDSQLQSKRPYERPYLQVYGDLAEITNTVGSNGRASSDGGNYRNGSPTPHPLIRLTWGLGDVGGGSGI